MPARRRSQPHACDRRSRSRKLEALLLPRLRRASLRPPRGSARRVEPLALAEREEARPRSGCSRRGERARRSLRRRCARAADGGAGRPAISALRARERFAPTAVMLAPVHESCIGTERDVVEEETVADPPDVDASSLAAVEGGERARGDRCGRGPRHVRSGSGSRRECRRSLRRSRARPRDRGERPVSACIPRSRPPSRERAPENRRLAS